jgi:D-serine deaminase-like pyridoxal phosphate-dependent protein
MIQQYQNYLEALKDVSNPSLFLDLEAFYKNLHWVISHSGDKKIRIATKSIRSVEILKKIHASNPVFQGFMTYTLEESLWLKSLGLKDLLIGYPTTDRSSLNKLAEDPSEIVLMVDRIEHLDLLEEIAAAKKTTFEICVDLDLSLDLPGVRFGVYRSQLHETKHLIHFLNHLKSCTHLKLVGAMGYEAQIAGVTDDKSKVMQVLKIISLTQLQGRRQRMVEMILAEGHKLRIVNGGGTGSLKNTNKEKVVTEITIGSAFYAPVLFDHYQDFKLTPALFFSSPIVRHPSKDIFTILGGGYIASGQTDDIKQPRPYLPPDLSLIKNEGAGEVQTPLSYTGHLCLEIGDLVIMRHAKAGEICERFNQIHIIEKNKILETVSTYRGQGKCFL